MDNSKTCRKYLLNPAYALRGWLMLPYGIQRTNGTQCEFMPKHDYSLLLDCDGQTDILYDELPKADRARYDYWESEKVICRCEEGQLLPHQKYRYYNNRYKDSVQ